jgi:predicted dehydrogenase
MTKPNRRQFIRDSALSVAGVVSASSINSEAASQARVLGANDRIRVGLIGCGGQGTGDLRAMLRAGVECVALCDVDDTQTAKTRALVENQHNQKPTLFTRDFRKVLEEKSLDAVIVGTPDHWHALPTIMACQAGKDVYVEKPLSLTIGEGRVMVDAARKYNRVVQMGTQQRSSTHFKEAIEYLRSGKLGKIRLVKTWAYQDWMGNIPKVPDEPAPATVDYDMWLGPAPLRPFNKNRFHFDFRWYFDYSGGLMTDWGAHMIDIANWGMGVKAPNAAFLTMPKRRPIPSRCSGNFPALACSGSTRRRLGRGRICVTTVSPFTATTASWCWIVGAGKCCPKRKPRSARNLIVWLGNRAAAGAGKTCISTTSKTSWIACARASGPTRMWRSVTTR